MAKFIQTPVDDQLVNDVSLEAVANPETYQDILGNAENIYKSFLYLKKMFSSSPNLNKILSIQKIDSRDETTIEVNSEASIVVVKNIDDQDIYVTINNNDSLTLFQYEQFDIPVEPNITIKVKGKSNIIQVRYEIG